MSVGLYLDDDTGLLGLVSQAARAGLTVVRSDDVGMRGAPDREHLQFAISEQLVLVTCNVRDFVRLHREWTEREEDHFGIFLARPGITAGERIRRLLLIAAAAEPEEFKNQLEWLHNWA